MTNHRFQCMCLSSISVMMKVYLHFHCVEMLRFMKRRTRGVKTRYNHGDVFSRFVIVHDVCSDCKQFSSAVCIRSVQIGRQRNDAFTVETICSVGNVR